MAEENQEPGKTRLQKMGLFSGIGLFLIVILFLDLEPGNPVITRMAAITVLMAAWWILDAVPLYATALVPMLLYPLLGIASAKDTAPIYFNSTIFLFMGGFMIALTMEKWNLHKRIAVVIIRAIGGGPARIVLGFMAATAFLSMWMSNTATANMMAEMARTGLLINIIGAVLLTLYLYFLLPTFLGAEPGVLPEWAQHIETGAK